MSDWTTDATDAIDRTVALVRERTVEPVHNVVRALVFGLLAALVVAPAFIILTAGAFRALVIIYQGYVFAAWLTLGGIFLAAGWFCWNKRNS
jgi:hypothetical protein